VARGSGRVARLRVAEIGAGERVDPARPFDADVGPYVDNAGRDIQPAVRQRRRCRRHSPRIAAGQVHDVGWHEPAPKAGNECQA
jgi:hypothetical protein